MPDTRPDLGPPLELPGPRTPLHVRFDLQDAACNIDELIDELRDDGSNHRYVARRIEAEIQYMRELLDELAGLVRP